MQTEPPIEQRVCPVCQTKARTSAAFCRICGERLKPPEGQKSAEVEGSRTAFDHQAFCSTCGQKNLPGETFCIHCGVQLPPIASHPPPLPSKNFKDS